MNGSQKFTYVVDIDVASAEAAAKKLQQIYAQSLAQVRMPAGEGGGALAAMQAQQNQMSAASKAGSAERAAAAKAEADAKIKTANDTSNAVIAAEKRTTAEIKTEAAARQSSLRAPGLGGELIPGFGGAQALLATSIAGVGIGYAAKAVTDQALALDEQATSYKRVDLAARTLAGSQTHLNELMATYTEATGGMIDKQTSLATVTRLMSVGFADSAEELEQFTRAVRGISVATGQNQDYIGSQLQLAIANQSTMRLDQLGLGVSEVKDRINELQAANADLSKEQAYQTAILGLATEKYGALTTATDAQATSVEKLKVSFADWRTEISKPISNVVEGVAEGIRSTLFPNIQDVRDRLSTAADTNDNLAGQLGMGDNARGLREAINLVDDLTRRINAGKDVPKEYADAIRQAADEALKYGHITADTAERIALFNQVLGAGVSDTINLDTALGSAAMSQELLGSQSADTSEELATLAGTTRDAAGELGYLVDLAYSAGAGLDDLGDKADVLASKLAGVRAENAQFTAMTGALSRGAINTAVDLSKIIGPDAAESMVNDALQRIESQGQAWRRGGGLSPLQAAMEEARAKDEIVGPLSDIIKEDEKQRKETEAAQKKAASEWERAGKKTQADFERAAANMVKEFESGLEKVLGLFSHSDVTPEDMAMAAAGIYQPKADEYLRRLKDEVESGQDKYADVSVEEAAKAIGISGAVDPKGIYAAFQKAWDNQTLFEDKANLRFINWEAVARDSGTGRASQLGRQNIIDYAGLSPEIVRAMGFPGILPGRMMTPGMAGSAQDYMMQMAGGGEGSAIKFPADDMTSKMMQGAEGGFAKFGTDAITMIASAMTGDEAAAQWEELGKSVGVMMTTAIEEGIAGTDFVGIVVAEALKQLNDALDNAAPA